MGTVVHMNTTQATETFNWAVVEGGGISDRFATRDEALAELDSYDPDATVEWAPEDEFPSSDA